jgi:hypothetical protein
VLGFFLFFSFISPHTERYLELLKEAKIRGYLFQQQNYIPADYNANNTKPAPEPSPNASIPSPRAPKTS